MINTGMICTKSQEYKDRFIAHMTGQGVMPSSALIEYEALVDAGDMDETSNPELDADECTSYWGD